LAAVLVRILDAFLLGVFQEIEIEKEREREREKRGMKKYERDKEKSPLKPCEIHMINGCNYRFMADTRRDI